MILISLILISHLAFAEGGGSQIGILYGLSVPDSDNTTPRTLYGIKGSALVSPFVTVGGYSLMSGDMQGSGGRTFDYSFNGLELGYRAESSGGESFYAARFGISKILTKPAATKIIFSPYHYGFAAGYDYFVLPWASLGFEGSFYYVEKSETVLSGTQYVEDSFSAIQFLVTVLFKL